MEVQTISEREEKSILSSVVDIKSVLDIPKFVNEITTNKSFSKYIPFALIMFGVSIIIYFGRKLKT